MPVLPRREMLGALASVAAFGLGTDDGWAEAPKKKSVAKPVPPHKPKLVMIDPGHGGRDPGALGVRGTQEKSVVITIARDLQRELLAAGRYRVLLTRGSDSYLALRERVARAQEAKADLFLSLHADSHPASEVGGASGYPLSEAARDREAAATG